MLAAGVTWYLWLLDCFSAFKHWWLSLGMGMGRNWNKENHSRTPLTQSMIHLNHLNQHVTVLYSSRMAVVY